VSRSIQAGLSASFSRRIYMNSTAPSFIVKKRSDFRLPADIWVYL
jgi:hypothetical protein